MSPSVIFRIRRLLTDRTNPRFGFGLRPGFLGHLSSVWRFRRSARISRPQSGQGCCSWIIATSSGGTPGWPGEPAPSITEPSKERGAFLVVQNLHRHSMGLCYRLDRGLKPLPFLLVRSRNLDPVGSSASSQRIQGIIPLRPLPVRRYRRHRRTAGDLFEGDKRERNL
jgi:hypothetical protein